MKRQQKHIINPEQRTGIMKKAYNNGYTLYTYKKGCVFVTVNVTVYPNHVHTFIADIVIQCRQDRKTVWYDWYRRAHR